MKEAAGEANVTVLTILLIGIVALVATPLITSIMNSTKNRSCCTNAGGKWSGNKCVSQAGYDAATYNSCIKDNPNAK
ncbi:MAG: hypothetical protein KH135_02765 [Firmicutes bacterium]|nr:hypothetical protein [Bacillota bacterium]